MARRNPSLALVPEAVTPRDVLRQRQTAAAVAHKAVQQAEAVLARGRAGVEAAERQVETGADAETRIRAHRVAALKAGRSAADPLPEVLAMAQTIHRDAKASLSDAAGVIGALQDELAAAQFDHRQTLLDVEAAAQAVVCEDAARVVAELQDAEAAVVALRAHLQAMGGIHVTVNHSQTGSPFAGTVGPIRLPPAAAMMAGYPTNLDQVPRPNRHEAWAGYFRALQQNSRIAAPA